MRQMPTTSRFTRLSCSQLYWALACRGLGIKHVDQNPEAPTANEGPPG